MTRKWARLFAAVLAASFGFTGQGCRPAAATSGVPVPSLLHWARCVRWDSINSVTHITVYPAWKGMRKPLRYVLEPTNQARRADPGTTVIPVPARRIVCLTSVHAGYLAALGVTREIVAVGDARDLYDSSLRAAVRAGRIAEVGSGSQLNPESVLALHPDVVLANAVDPEDFAALQRLQSSGVAVFVSAEWMEVDPLARAEWLRVFGRLVGQAHRADSLFAVEAAVYQALAQRAKAAKQHPTVLVGAPFRDTWFVPGGRSFMAEFLADAGADYLWRRDTTVGGVPMSLEAVYRRARDADIWLDPSDWRSLEDGRRQDARLADFTAFQRGAVYNNNARVALGGGNDFWESGAVYPHRILSDLLVIFHSEAFHQSLFYYRRLPATEPATRH